jgi:hypothetical protein
VHTTLKVPNCDCRGPYHVDFLGASFVANPHVFALKNFRKINGQFFENGTIGNRRPPPASKAINVNSPRSRLNMIQLVSVGHELAVGSFVIEVAAGYATVGSTPAPAAGLN